MVQEDLQKRREMELKSFQVNAAAAQPCMASVTAMGD